RRFDLAHGPVFRTVLYTLAAQSHLLLMTVHHIAEDGWSLMILLDEMLALYREAVAGANTGLRRPELQYVGYATCEDDLLGGPDGERLWSYWRDRLAAPRARIDLPLDHPRPAIASGHGASVPLQLPSALTTPLKKLAKDKGTTPFVVLLSLFQVL